MHKIKFCTLAATFVFAGIAGSSTSQAQISVSIGAAPNCPYGYYDAAPYNCAPYGYYGPEWFSGGVFIGAGQWYHGPSNFHGHVNNSFDARRGYRGPVPNRGDRADRRTDQGAALRGNEMRDGRGHADQGDRGEQDRR